MSYEDPERSRRTPQARGPDPGSTGEMRRSVPPGGPEPLHGPRGDLDAMRSPTPGDPREGREGPLEAPDSFRSGQEPAAASGRRGRRARGSTRSAAALDLGPDVPPGRRRGRGPLITALVVLVVGGLVAAIAVIGINMVGSGNEANPTADAPVVTGAAPSSYSNAPSSAVFAAIGKRSADKRPLTTSEVFTKETKSLADKQADVVLKLRASRIDGNCAAAVWGASLTAELRKAGCTQVVRGLYSDSKGRYAAAVSILNLSGVREADALTKRLSPDVGDGFVRPLPGEAPLDKFGQGFSLARGRALGHYSVVAWVQRTDGEGDEEDAKLLSLVITMGKADSAILRRTIKQR